MFKKNVLRLVGFSVNAKAPGIVKRVSVGSALHTGVLAIDSLIPVGHGQRELIIGDRQTGKTTLTVDAIINQYSISRTGWAGGSAPFFPKVDFLCIYVAIGQRASSVIKIWTLLKSRLALDRTVLVAALSSDNCGLQYLAPFVGSAIGEG